MWASVQRGGPFFNDGARVIEKDNSFECVLYFAPGGLPKETRPPLEKYMRSYASASGWNVKSLRFKKGYACLVVAPKAASKAASKASKKR